MTIINMKELFTQRCPSKNADHTDCKFRLLLRLRFESVRNLCLSWIDD